MLLSSAATELTEKSKYLKNPSIPRLTAILRKSNRFLRPESRLTYRYRPTKKITTVEVKINALNRQSQYPKKNGWRGAERYSASVTVVGGKQGAPPTKKRGIPESGIAWIY
jgi:hypothetical protein